MCTKFVIHAIQGLGWLRKQYRSCVIPSIELKCDEEDVPSYSVQPEGSQWYITFESVVDKPFELMYRVCEADEKWNHLWVTSSSTRIVLSRVIPRMKHVHVTFTLQNGDVHSHEMTHQLCDYSKFFLQMEKDDTLQLHMLKQALSHIDKNVWMNQVREIRWVYCCDEEQIKTFHCRIGG